MKDYIKLTICSILLICQMLLGVDQLGNYEFEDGLPIDWSTNSESYWEPGVSDGNGYMIVDSFAAGYVDLDEFLISPEISCSGYAHVVLQYTHEFLNWSNEYADVDFRYTTSPSPNESDWSGWETVAFYEGADYFGFEKIDLYSFIEEEIDKTSISKIQIRWHYYNAFWDWYWIIDDVTFCGYSSDEEVFTISGEVINQAGDPIDDVVVSAVYSGGIPPVTSPGVYSTMTNSDGSYSIDVPYWWQGNISASKAGYEFSQNIEITDIITDMDNKNFHTTYKTISGKIYILDNSNDPLEGVQVTADNIDDVFSTDTNGYYELPVPHGWKGQLYLHKSEWSFGAVNEIGEAEEDVHGFVRTRVYTEMLEDDKPNQDYQAGPTSLNMSGYVRRYDGQAISGAQILINGVDPVILTDENGHFAFDVDFWWSGSVSVSKSGFMFITGTHPDSYQVLRTYELPLISNSNNQNFYGSDLFISGMITTTSGEGIGAVSIDPGNGLPTVKTYNDGTFSVNVPYNWDITLTPSKDGFAFEPDEINISQIQTSHTNHDFYGGEESIIVTGYVERESGEAVSGIPVRPVSTDVSLELDSCITDVDGFYELYVPFYWSGEIKPESPNYLFSNLNTENPITNIGENINDYDFKGLTIFVTGQISWPGGQQGISGVKVKVADNDEINVISDEDGYYCLQLPYEWSGVIVPEKADYNFDTVVFSEPLTHDRVQNFVCDNVRISGYIYDSSADSIGLGIEGVQLIAVDTQNIDYTAISDEKGYYELVLEMGQSYTVNLEKPGYEFLECSP